MRILEQCIAVNRVRCNSCKEIITSEHQHDFRWCKCHSIAVDGGTAYLKRCGDLEGYIDLSEYGYREREITEGMEDMYRDMVERGDNVKILED